MARSKGPEEMQELLAGQAYLADRGLAIAVHVAMTLGRPLLLEGDAGVGKTELARALATGLGVRLIRLQCYEGIDASQALYDWNYPRQLLHVRMLSGTEGEAGSPEVSELFGPEFLVERPLLAAVRAGGDAVLLIDEIDRADDEFEAFLLEILSDFTVTIPEVGTIRCEERPVVILTSNRTRDLHDALKRRCIYHWINYPSLEKEMEILRARAPGIASPLDRQIPAAVQRIRELDLVKPPGVAETIDWAGSLAALGVEKLTPGSAADTLGSLLKEREDLERVRAVLPEILREEGPAES
jgi:MoxR-like ATPase